MGEHLKEVEVQKWASRLFCNLSLEDELAELVACGFSAGIPSLILSLFHSRTLSFDSNTVRGDVNRQVRIWWLPPLSVQSRASIARAHSDESAKLQRTRKQTSSTRIT